MASKKRNQKQGTRKRRRYYGSGATMSMGQAPRLSVEEKLKQKYIKRIMGKIRGYYNRIQLISAVEMRFQPNASWKPMFMLKPNAQTDAHIKFSKLKHALKYNDIVRTLFLPDDIDKEQWLDTFYSEVAFAYLNSKNYKEFIKNIENRRAEFFMLFETVYLPKHITVTEVPTMGNKEGDSELIALDNHLYIDKTYYETVNGHIYKITCKLVDEQLSYGSDILFNMYLFFFQLHLPSDADSLDLQKNRLFDENGFRRLNPDKADTLLHTMSTHPEAKQTLTPDVVDEIIKLTSK